MVRKKKKRFIQPVKRGRGRPRKGKNQKPINTEAAIRHREYIVKKDREQRIAASDIGKIPKCKNPKRRAACLASFALFCVTYFPEIFYLPWSKDLLKVIKKIERVVIEHEKFAVAMPRGSGKTRLSQSAILWAILSGRHKSAMLIGAVAPQATDAIAWFKKVLSENDLLLEDFPEVCFPIRKLDNEPRRCLGQRYRGKKTNIRWSTDKIVLPTIPGKAASGSVIKATSLEGHIRGAWESMPGGKVVRPTFALCDDPQTSESARSQGPTGQTTRRMELINQDVQGLAGPDQQTAILVPCTVICAGDLADQLLDRKQHPDFRGERTKRIYSWPKNKNLWEQYRELREGLMSGDQPLDEANAFYLEHSAKCGKRMDEQRDCEACEHAAECMDCGAVVDWAERLDDPKNISAVQAAMHAFYKYGAQGFSAEFQNEPLSNEGSEERLTVQMCQQRFTGRKQNEVPLECTELTMGVDVQQSSLWYVVVGWKPDFTGYIVDYGIWPKQVRRVLALAEIAAGPNNLQTHYPGARVEGTIQAGLEAFIQAALGMDYPRSGGAGLMRLSRILVDAGKWPNVIAAVKYKVGGATMSLSKGIGIKAGNRPMSTFKRKKGERFDPLGHWYMPNTHGTREFPHVAIDVNYWKTFVHSGFLTAPGDPGALTLFGDNPETHALFAGHMTAESFVKTHGHGRDVFEWKIKPQRPDNHWLDALVYATCGASVQGITMPNQKEPPRTGVMRIKRVPASELMARRDHGGGQS